MTTPNFWGLCVLLVLVGLVLAVVGYSWGVTLILLGFIGGLVLVILGRTRP